MKNYKDENLEITLNESDKITMCWLGRSDSREPSAVLNPYINSVIEELGGKKIEVDFSKLEYMNSSTVPPIIQMLKSLNTKGINTVIYYDKNSKWQAASFKALETIANSMSTIEVVGK